MKITNIRCNKTNKKLTFSELKTVAEFLECKLGELGYITQSSVKNSSRIDLGLHMRSFKIDVNMLGYNAQYNPYMNYKAGYKKTSTPTWSQRVCYNNTINDILDRYNIKANIKSGDYTIRKGFESYNEVYWENQKPSWQYRQELRGHIICKLP